MRSRYLFFLGGGIVLFLLLSLTVTSFTAYAMNGYVTGQITKCSSPGTPIIPISGAKVTVLGTSAFFTTGSDGYYIIELPPCSPPGYTLRTKATGYVTKDTPNVMIYSGQATTVNICLTPAASSPSFQEGISEQDGSEASLENDNDSTLGQLENAIQILQDVKNQILLLDPTVFKTPERQNALVKKYDTVIRNIQEGRYDLALRKLQYGILIIINGCNRLGQSDGNDWIIDCEAQKSVYDSTEEVKEIVQKDLTAGLTPTDLTIEPVLKAVAKVHGIAWDDMNGNGTQDPGEPVIPGPSMRLYGPYSYGPLNRTSAGYYSFLVTPANNYHLECSATGFITQDRYPVNLSPGETETQNFGMQR